MKSLMTAVFLAFLAVPALAGAYVEVSEISVKPAAFSPNGDGTNDSTVVSFTTTGTADSAQLYVDVIDSSEDTVAVLADGGKFAMGPAEFTWDGTDSSGSPVAEGTYVFEIVASADNYTTPPYSASVRLDVTPPRVATYIHPNPYAPNVPLADTMLTVEIDVTDAQGGDLLEVTLDSEEPAETLCTITLVARDSTYICEWDGRETEDGFYELQVKTGDPAGNSMQVSYAVDLDLDPPLIFIESPEETYLDYIPETYWVSAWDKNLVDSLKVRFYSGTEYMVPDGYPRDECCYTWPESLRIEDEFTLEVAALDGVGHWGYKVMEVVADTTAPQVPALDPLPSKVGSALLEVTGTGTPLDSVRVYLNGALKKRALITSGGSFSAVVELSLGTNLIYAESADLSGNESAPSEVVSVEYTEETGIRVPEEFGEGSRIEVNLTREAHRITVRILSLEGSYITSIVENGPELLNELEWDLKDKDGDQVKNGVYVLVIEVAYVDGSADMEKKAVIVSR
jgi:hypothetical protein